ncbi:hypothetical protein [Myroides odoratus]|uniref:Uncharacterized protein n=1 Tax=Myroides odoratus TaxID=256 RepID=A0A9Q6Z3W9_MYROD|nr:hypothetical protein [Myroides odoratus]EHQ41574.1 hypothetical protein Myrod_0738 [Myroides odoratus DSM 2801]EKB02729.1 hypothetical protein HMPREF9716_03662 [Myroides odoratus CIP 103059]QQT98990.1 hypothetical protein I6I88_12300 [Myroides odoratus]WQD58820.1 hypothetical protein U0010_06670 [Myroides odoratus]STZ28838.1 Uncharacterised protein [Myroides odoratus]
MKTKEEVIREAWGDNYNDQINKNGWLTVGFNYEYNHNDFDTIRYLDCVEIRPKSLQGIESNNGWIRIESKKDLPKESCPVFIKDFTGCISEIPYYYFNEYKLFKGQNTCLKWEDVISYSTIFKPKKPHY